MIKKVLITLAIGIGISFGGLIVSGFAFSYWNGSSEEVAVICGWGSYLCFVIIICTSFLVSAINKKK